MTPKSLQRMEKMVLTDVLWAKARRWMEILQSASTSAVTASMRAGVWMDFFKLNFLQSLLFLPALIGFKILYICAHPQHLVPIKVIHWSFCLLYVYATF
jgi:hypothetical protein